MSAKFAKLTDLRILGTASPGAAPLLVGRDISEDVVIRLGDNKEVVRAAGINSGHLDANGSVSLATSPKNRADGTFELIVQKKSEGELVRHTIQPANLKAEEIDNWAVAHGHLFVQTTVGEPDDEKRRGRVFVAALPTDDPVKSLKPLGEIKTIKAAMSVCRSNNMVGAMFSSHTNFLTFKKDGAWWSPPKVERRLGAMLHCDGDAMVFYSHGRITECKTKGCGPRHVTDDDFGSFKAKRQRRTVLNDKILGLAESELRQGVRYVLGKGEPQLLFDDFTRKGEVQTNSTLKGTLIFGQPDFALIVLITEEGVLGFHVGKDGKAKPVAVKWQ